MSARIIVLMGLCLAAAALFAQNTIHVPGDQSTIQAGINVANPGDTVLVAPGTYYENINFNGKAITVTSSAGSAQTIIDGSGLDSVVFFDSGEGRGSVLNGFTVQNGAPNGKGRGSGVYIYAASPTLTNNTIQNNIACEGPGISSNSGAPKIQGNLIQNNVGPNFCLGGNGGGLFLGSANFAQVIENVIVNNTVGAGNGGGIALNGAHGVTIANNVISGNTAAGISPAAGGGGIWIINLTDATIVQNLIYNNSAGQGGGIYFIVPQGSPGLTLVNNTIANNNVTMTPNQGSAVYASYFANQSQISNNLLIGYSGQDAIYCAFSVSVPVLMNNDAYTANGMGFDGACAGQSGQSGNISAAPLFVNAPSGDFHLQPTSPAVDAGTNAAPNLPPTDFAGNPRILDGNNDCASTVDMGAYELVRNANVNFSVNSLTFASQAPGTTSVPQSVMLNNTGGTCFLFSSVGTTGDFGETNGCGAGVRGGASCTFSVTFSPTALGTRLGSLTVSGSDGITSTSPMINLSGIGADFSVTANPASASVKHGQSVVFGVNVSPQGGAFNSTVSLSCSGLPTGAACSYSPARVTPGANGAAASLTLSTLGKTPRGNYNVLVVGTSGTASHSATVLLSVN